MLWGLFWQVGISHPEGCVPWWSKTIRGGDTICPKDCALSGFKGGYNNLGRACLEILLPALHMPLIT